MMEINHVTLKDFTSLRIGGEVDMVVVKSEEELVEAINYAKAEGFRVHILGEGTNTYFAEHLENFFVIKIKLKGIELKPLAIGYELLACAGENWDDVVKFAIGRGLWGIENLSYIPGTVGAAPVQNIGAYGMELKDTLVSLKAYDIQENTFVELTNEACHFTYRDSIFKHPASRVRFAGHVVGRYIITSVTLKLSQEKNPVLTYKPLDALVGKEDITLEEIRNTVIQTRTTKLPDYTIYPNTGSFFKNPIVTKDVGKELQLKYPDIKLISHDDHYKISAAWLIEHVGEYKGMRVGNIGTWPLQPLVIVNYDNGTADELHDFVQTIVDKVKSKTGVILEREVNFIQ